MIMASCILGIMYHITEEFEEFLKVERKKRKIPIPAKHFGLFMILLNYNNKLEFKEISEKWRKSKSTLCDIISKYVEIGLIEKENCCLDKRNVFVKLTAEGLEYGKIFEEISMRYLEQITGG
uniref:winged helix DNA-binding protein n=1 Tax=Ilyobacter sp. TaxID=3100343 RepID=UPI00356496DD